MPRMLMTILISCLPMISSAQGVLEREHPRVSELQDKMTEYARGYLQTRLQGVPFMVTVKIEALRRKEGSNYRPQNEQLPYFDIAEEEIRDEWDDPSASLYVLQSRIQKATILISLPEALKDEEIQEIRDSLTVLLRLIPGRDEIKIEQRNWSLGPNFWNYSFLTASALILLLIGLGYISRNWAQKLASAIHEIKPKEKTESEAMTNAPVNLPSSTVSAQKNTGGDLKFRDPIKTREFVSARVMELGNNPSFPNLQAMIEMEKLAELAPGELGALLMEFPLNKQKEIFGFSYSPAWMSALTEPGELGSQSLALLDQLCRIQYDAHPQAHEQLIMHVWRHGSQRVNFLRTIPKEDAFWILKAMPSSIAVPTARSAFPGAWASLLDPSFKPNPIDQKRVKELTESLIKSKPLNDFVALERYRQEKDLLDYLLIASLSEEKDIYGAIPQDSYLWQVRPPFYQVLESPIDSIKLIFDRVTLDEWAFALFNVSRDHRRPIEGLFNSKQKFLFLNKMRTIDQNGFDKKVGGEVREKISRLFHSLNSETKVNPENNDVRQHNEGGMDNEETAA